MSAMTDDTLPASPRAVRDEMFVFAAMAVLLAMVPAMLLLQSAMERQRVLDAQVRAMLKGPPRPPQRPASASP